MWQIFLRDSTGMFNLVGTATTRKQAVKLRQEAGALAKSRGANGASVWAQGPCGQLKIGIHGYK